MHHRLLSVRKSCVRTGPAYLTFSPETRQPGSPRSRPAYGTPAPPAGASRTSRRTRCTGQRRTRGAPPWEDSRTFVRRGGRLQRRCRHKYWHSYFGRRLLFLPELWAASGTQHETLVCVCVCPLGVLCTQQVGQRTSSMPKTGISVSETTTATTMKNTSETGRTRISSWPVDLSSNQGNKSEAQAHELHAKTTAQRYGGTARPEHPFC